MRSSVLSSLISRASRAVSSRNAYFQQVFGHDCVDAPGGHAEGAAGADLEAYVRLRTDLRNAIPLAEKIGKANEVSLFTLIEFLYDGVARPTDGFHHTFNNWGWHYRKFNQDAGQAEWRAEVNILDAPAPPSSAIRDREKIASAVHRFRLGRSTPKERADAVLDLADVLEFHRPQVQVHLLRKDESDLFNIANNFGIRHHNQRQQTDYSKAWPTWMFYLYLSTIHLVLRLVEEQNRSDVAPSGSGGETPR